MFLIAVSDHQRKVMWWDILSEGGGLTEGIKYAFKLECNVIVLSRMIYPGLVFFMEE